MIFDKNSETGFSLVEVIVALAILSTSMAVTVPIIARNRWQVDVDRYATQLETGLYGLRAKLGSRKTSCLITFPTGFNFLEPRKITEFSKGENTETEFKCCDSEISSLTNDPDCKNGYDGHKISEKTGRPLDNLRLVQTESTPESKNVRVAFTSTKLKDEEDMSDFGFTPPGTTARAGSLTFLICHHKSASENNSMKCIQNKNKLSTRCVKIEGNGAIERGRWVTDTGSVVTANGHCQTT